MPIKLASFAGVWRYDEPQAERYRYFHQWDIEIYGPSTKESDAEVIEFVYIFFQTLGLKVKIEINDRQLIEEYITKKIGINSEETMLEMFRAIDKVPKKGADVVLAEYKERVDVSKMQALIELSELKGNVDEIASRSDVRELESWQRLVSLMDLLKAKKVKGARINLGIVRGLDYYSGVVFEAFDDMADSVALVGGGRYNRLTEAFGRKDIGASGVAGGVERIVIALKKHGLLKQYPTPLVYVAHATGEMKAKALDLVSSLRADGIRVDYDMIGRTLRKQLECASNQRAAFVVIIAPNEIASGQVILRSMKDGTESKHHIGSLKEIFGKMLRV